MGRSIKGAKSGRNQKGEKLKDIIHYIKANKRNKNSDMMTVRKLEHDLEPTPGYIEELQYSNTLNMSSRSTIDKIARYLKKCSLEKGIDHEDIKLVEDYLDSLIDKLNELKCADNKNVKLEIELMQRKMKQIIAQMEEIVQNNKNEDIATALVLGKISELSSELEPNKKTLGNEFSFLNGAIEDSYIGKKRKDTAIRIGAGALAGATIFGGAAVGVYSAYQEQKAEEVINGLKSIYGSKLSDDIKSEYIDEDGRVKTGAYEEVKKLALNRGMKIAINNSLKEKGAEAWVTDVKVSFGEHEEGNDTNYFIAVSGTMNNSNTKGQFDCTDKYTKGFDSGGFSYEIGNKKVKKYCSTLDSASIPDIIKGEGEVGEKINEIADKSSIDALVVSNNTADEKAKAEKAKAEDRTDYDDYDEER